MKKKIGIITALMMFTVSIAACSSSAQTKESVPAAESSIHTPSAEGSQMADDSEMTLLNAEEPIALTASGQSADFDMMKVILDQVNLSYSADSLMEPEGLNDCKTLIVVIGGSSKGLGAAGIDAETELKRVEKLLSKAKEQGINVLSVHIGGEGRRGALGDRFIEPSVAESDGVIVVAAGNKDGLFTELGTKYGIPVTEVNAMVDTTEVMKSIFGQE